MVQKMTLEDEIKDYGEIIFKIRQDAPNQLYVIGQSHKKLDGTQSEHIPKIQMEVFRIGQKLIDKFKVGLFLAEGYFENTVYEKKRKENIQETDIRRLAEYCKDDDYIVSSTKDHADWDAVFYFQLFTNVNIQGAEDRIYHRNVITLLTSQRNPVSDVLYAYYNHLRTMAVLLNGPKVVDREQEARRLISSNFAIIFGDDHIPKLIESVEKDYFKVDFSRLSPLPFDKISQPLKYEQLGYGATVIRPKSTKINRNEENLLERYR